MTIMKRLKVALNFSRGRKKTCQTVIFQRCSIINWRATCNGMINLQKLRKLSNTDGLTSLRMIPEAKKKKVYKFQDILYFTLTQFIILSNALLNLLFFFCIHLLLDQEPSSKKKKTFSLYTSSWSHFSLIDSQAYLKNTNTNNYFAKFNLSVRKKNRVLKGWFFC